MELKAEVLISDCEIAIERHSDQLQGYDFRLSWFLIIALLRSIGQVLDKVDSESSSKLKEIIDRKWKESKPRIFTEFIETERNSFLKEYNHSVKRGMTVKGNPYTIEVDMTSSVSTRFESPDGIINSVIKTGPFAGRNEKDVAIEALNWWKQYIRDIKREYLKNA